MDKCKVNTRKNLIQEKYPLSTHVSLKDPCCSIEQIGVQVESGEFNCEKDASIL